MTNRNSAVVLAFVTAVTAAGHAVAKDDTDYVAGNPCTIETRNQQKPIVSFTNKDGNLVPQTARGYTSVGTGRNQAEVAYIISGDKAVLCGKTRQGATTEIISSGQISEAYELLKTPEVKELFYEIAKDSPALPPHDKALANNTTEAVFLAVPVMKHEFPIR
ncbi:MAG TPA: hypothetical protein PLE43_06305 [Alphaproteobacteria bacterium]|nr:hypothetical protein [Alphaproteobacteria bacterium]HRK98071.1 hypothetical protein [Alphaproteobacteria bacterium]